MTQAPTAVVRLWDSSHNLRHPVDAALMVADGPSRIITLPVDDPAARWLINEPPDRGCPSITVDDSNGRWTAPLYQWEIAKVGTCPHCEHCQARVVKSVWRMPFSSSRS